MMNRSKALIMYRGLLLYWQEWWASNFPQQYNHESNINIRKIKEMIHYSWSSWFLDKNSLLLVSTLGIVLRKNMENLNTDVKG